MAYSRNKKTQEYVVKNTIHWREIARAIGIFLFSFFICFFFTKYLFSWFTNQSKKTEITKIEPKTKPISSSLVTSFSQAVKTVSALLPKSQYDYYQTKRQFIDPILIKEALDKKDPNILIVDIRSTQEYKSAHIKTAISAPSYTNSQDVYESLTQKEDIRTEIGKYIKGKRLVVIYGYTPNSDISQDVYENLKQIFPVRVMGISWYEWRSNFYSWMPSSGLNNFSINNYLEGDEIKPISQSL